MNAVENAQIDPTVAAIILLYQCTVDFDATIHKVKVLLLTQTLEFCLYLSLVDFGVILVATISNLGHCSTPKKRDCCPVPSGGVCVPFGMNDPFRVVLLASYSFTSKHEGSVHLE